MFLNPEKAFSWLGRRRRRSLLKQQRDAYFNIHIRNKRFIDKIICDGIVGGGCKGMYVFNFLISCCTVLTDRAFPEKI